MENNNNQDNNNGKMSPNGQTILVLVVAAVITLMVITLMRDMVDKKFNSGTFLYPVCGNGRRRQSGSSPYR